MNLLSTAVGKNKTINKYELILYSEIDNQVVVLKYIKLKLPS